MLVSRNPLRTHCVAFSRSGIKYEEEEWATPQKLCIDTIMNATIDLQGLIFDTRQAYTFGKWYFKKLHRSIHRPPDRPNFEEAHYISFVHKWQDVFQHIAFDTLPKMKLICPYLERHSRINVLVTGKLQKALLMEVCELDSIRFKVLKRTLSARKISFPHFLGSFPMGIMPPGSIKPLNARATGSQIIYMPRKPGKRAVKNEAALLNLLNMRYRSALVVYAPTNDWRVDREVFASASVILGPHGGAFGNIIFAPQRTTVIEFLSLTQLKRAGKNERPCYFGLATGLGFDYHALEIDGFDFETELFVPLTKLESLLVLIDDSLNRQESYGSSVTHDLERSKLASYKST